MSQTVSFQIGRQHYAISDEEVLGVARQAIARGLPAKAKRFKSWALIVDGVPLGIRWLFSQVTGIPEIEFDITLAQDILEKQLGMDVVNLSHDERRAMTDKVSSSRQRTASLAQQEKHRIPREEYDEFFSAIREQLPPLLTAETRNCQFQARANYFQIAYEPFGGCHYEIALRRNYHEIALHFESSQRVCQARLQPFLSQVETLSAQLGTSVRAAPWGGNRAWTRVWMECDVKPLTGGLAAHYAARMADFIAATFPILQQAFDAPTHKREKKPRALPGKTIPAYQILDREVEQVRSFLEGRSDYRPTDEKICDWIQFCYLFELNAEGRDLFKLLAHDDVNPWYLERTRKFAKICELRAKQST